MPLKGHRMSEEQKRKIADAHRGKPKPKFADCAKGLGGLVVQTTPLSILSSNSFASQARQFHHQPALLFQ